MIPAALSMRVRAVSNSVKSMFDHFKKLEARIESILIENGFEKTSESVSTFGAKLLYRSKSGLYFQIQSDYRDRIVLLFIGHRYNVEGNSKRYFISGRYQDVAKACSCLVEGEFWVGKFSSWEAFADNVVIYIQNTLGKVLQAVTSEILEELANEQISRRPSQFRFYRTD